MLISDVTSSRYLPHGLATRTAPGLSPTMPSSEVSSLTRQALNISVVILLTCICLPFSRMGIHTKFGPGPFRCLQKWCFKKSEAFRRLPAFGELDTISQPPLGLCSENTALDFFVSRLISVSLRFLWGAHRPPRPLQYMVLIADHAWLR